MSRDANGRSPTPTASQGTVVADLREGAPRTAKRRAPRRETGDRLRVLIVDDDPFVRRIVRDVLQGAGLVVVAEAAGGRDAVRLARYYQPDIVLMDVVMPGIDGMTALERILADSEGETKVVMLSVCDEEEVGLAAVRKGAIGYLKKDVDLGVLPRALRSAEQGAAVVSRRFTAKLLEQLRALPDGGIGMRPVQSVLTVREWEVLDLLCLECTTEEIADELVLSIETVRTHIKNLMRKLDVHSRAEAVARAHEMRGWAAEAAQADPA